MAGNTTERPKVSFSRKLAQNLFTRSRISPMLTSGCEEYFYLEDDSNCPSWLQADLEESHCNEGESKKVRFDGVVQILYTWSKLEYDRRGEYMIPFSRDMLVMARRELNMLKSQMEVHDESKHLTHFYKN